MTSTSAVPPVLGQRVDRFEYEVLDADLQVYETLNPTTDSAPSISASTDQAVMRKIDGIELIADDLARVANPLADRLRPVMVLTDGSRWPLGVYLFGEQQRERWSDTTTFGHTALMDQGWLLDQPLERSVGLRTGDNIEALFVQMAQEVGITQISLESTNDLAGAPTSWAAGTSRWQVMDECAPKMGCIHPSFNNSGLLVCRGAPAIDSTPDFSYAWADVYADTVLETDDSYRTPNRYIVIGTGQVPVVGIYDVPDEAPHSAARRGFVVAKTVDAPGVTDAFTAGEAARSAAITDTRGYLSVHFTAPLNPRHDLFNLIEWDGALYLETEQRLQLAPGGDHEHGLTRLW